MGVSLYFPSDLFEMWGVAGKRFKKPSKKGFKIKLEVVVNKVIYSSLDSVIVSWKERTELSPHSLLKFDEFRTIKSSSHDEKLYYS